MTLLGVGTIVLSRVQEMAQHNVSSGEAAFPSELVGQAQHGLVPALAQAAQPPTLVHLVAIVGYEEVSLHKAHDQPAELGTGVVDRVEYVERGRQQLAAQIQTGCSLQLPEHLAGQKEGRTPVQTTDPGRPVEPDESLPDVDFLHAEEAVQHRSTGRAPRVGAALIGEWLAELIVRLHPKDALGVAEDLPGLDIAEEGSWLGGVLPVGVRQAGEEYRSGQQAAGVHGEGGTSLHCSVDDGFS